jgi:hypothetical protein
MHDTIEMFSERLGELREIYERDVRPSVHSNRRSDLRKASDELFSKLSDVIREAALMASGRRLAPEAMRETCGAGLREIFG